MKTVSKLSQIRKLMYDGMLGGVDMVSVKKTGEIVFRREYYYRLNNSAQKFSDNVSERLKAAGIEFTVVQIGDHWAPFRAGASTAKSSHFYMIIK
jgi:hypothetical protein